MVDDKILMYGDENNCPDQKIDQTKLDCSYKRDRTTGKDGKFR